MSNIKELPKSMNCDFRRRGLERFLYHFDVCREYWNEDEEARIQIRKKGIAESYNEYELALIAFIRKLYENHFSKLEEFENFDDFMNYLGSYYGGFIDCLRLDSDILRYLDQKKYSKVKNS